MTTNSHSVGAPRLFNNWEQHLLAQVTELATSHILFTTPFGLVPGRSKKNTKDLPFSSSPSFSPLYHLTPYLTLRMLTNEKKKINYEAVLLYCYLFSLSLCYLGSKGYPTSMT